MSKVIIIFDSSTNKYKTWGEIIKAVRTGETVIKTAKSYKEVNRAKVYSNYFSKAIKKLGITDIRYGSTNGWMYGLTKGNYTDSYTLYTPKGWKAKRIIKK